MNNIQRLAAVLGPLAVAAVSHGCVSEAAPSCPAPADPRQEEIYWEVVDAVPPDACESADTETSVDTVAAGARPMMAAGGETSPDGAVCGCSVAEGGTTNSCCCTWVDNKKWCVPCAKCG